MHFPELAFATPRQLPRPSTLHGRVVVLDIAFAAEASGQGAFARITLPFLTGLGDRLVGWIDHHDHVLHAQYAQDPRFVLATKAEHGACPEMITPALVNRIGPVETIVCHNDFDGLCSAAKWIRQGEEPYPGADADAHAIDTRTGTLSPTGKRFDRALRVRRRDPALFGLIVRHLATGLSDPSLWIPIQEAAAPFAEIEKATHLLAKQYTVIPLAPPPGTPLPSHCTALALLDLSSVTVRYDKTELLLLGQALASMALLIDHETCTFAAPFDSGIDFLALFGLSGGMPTLVSLSKSRLVEALLALGVRPPLPPPLAGVSQ